MSTQIEVQIHDDGGITLVGVSMVEAFWFDYLQFKALALQQSSIFQQKRFLRGALMSFVAHVSGVVDSWCRRKATDDGIEYDEWRRAELAYHGKKPWYNFCLELQCKSLGRHAVDAGRELPDFNFKKVRNRIEHLEDNHDLALFAALTSELIQSAESEMIGWLECVGNALGYERLPDARKLTDEYAAEIRAAGVEVFAAVDCYPPEELVALDDE
jgi:hypothetical protein